VAVVDDAGAGEAAHGEEGAGIVVHAERARARAALLLDLALLPRSLSLLHLRAAIRAGNHGWLGRREAAALQSWRARDPTDGSTTRAVSRAAPRRWRSLV
jgi:hypothetical protein